jgi:hypothetical protein
MILQEKVDALHDAKVINKHAISDAYRSRFDGLSDEDIARLIEIADKLDPNRTSPAEISFLF